MTASRTYICEPGACDADADGVSWYREKRDIWTEWFSTDQHSIWNQLSGMMWNDTVFRTLNESRRLAYESGEGRSAMNSVIRELLDDGYVAFQTAAIRKLIEPAQRQASRQIISLRRVLDDMQASRTQLTREVFVCFDGAPYDYDTAYAAYLATNPESPGFTGVPTTGPAAFGDCARAHSKFDKLAGTDPSTRSRADLIAQGYFDAHYATLAASGADGIADYCNKFITHAADAASRKTAKSETVSLRLFEDCHRKLYKIAFALYADVLTDTEHMLATLSVRHPCENLDQIWSSEAELQKLYRFYDDRTEFIDGWRTDNY